VRNSVESVTVVTFTDGPLPLDCVVDGVDASPDLGIDVLDIYFGVENPLEGFEPAACWMSFPCSAIRAGPSFWRCFRSCGRIFDRTRSLTGCLLLESE